MRDHTFRHAGVLRAAPGQEVASLPAPAVDEAARRRLTRSLEQIARDQAAAIDRAAGEALLTDAAAVVLQLERTRLAAKRRRRAALLDAFGEPAAAAEAARLGGDEEEARRQIEDLRGLILVVRRRLSLQLAG